MGDPFHQSVSLLIYNDGNMVAAFHVPHQTLYSDEDEGKEEEMEEKSQKIKP